MELSHAAKEIIAAEMARGHIPGLTLAVVRDGELTHAAALGRAHLEWDIPAGIDTVYEIGSITKQMTATLVMMQLEAGRVDLDVPARAFLPALPEAWGRITVRHLLTHTSGLPNYTDLPGFTLRERLPRETFLARLARHPLAFTPGSQFAYNNSGYNMLGWLLEDVTGMHYGDLLKAKILDPLGMVETRPRNPRAIVPRRAAGYVFEDGALRNKDTDVSDVSAAGFLLSTVGDLAKWDAALGAGRFVSPETQETMWTPHVLPGGEATRYGFGWGIGETNGHRFVSHGGSTSGYSAAMRRFTGLALTLIALTNTETEDAALSVIKAVLPLVEPRLSA